jgi:N-acetyl sugar amidotransferase
MTYPPLWSAEIDARIRAEATNLDPQERPAHVQMCTQCVVTNQRPRIVFDDEGVCSACRYAERKRNGSIDWLARGAELIQLLDRHRMPSGYDVVVPCSGGKDSSFVAVTLRDEYGMRPLCATFAPFMYTDIGRRNMEAFVHAGFDVVTAAPNGLLHRKLARLAFEFYGDPWQPFAYGQLCWPMQVAAQNDINLVFFGENGEAEYGGDPSADDKPCWDFEDWDRVYTKGVAVDQLVELAVTLGALTKEECDTVSPFYRLPGPVGHPEFHWLGYYKRWHPQGNYYLASEKTGFEPNTERSEGTYSKYASIDDKLDGLHFWMAYQKFGIGRCTSDAAHEIRDGEIDRDEGLALVKRFDGELPVKYLEECLEYLQMDRDYLDVVAERFRP